MVGARASLGLAELWRSAVGSSPMMVETRSGLARMSSKSSIRHDVFVLGDDLVLLQAGQALQAHLQDLLRLGVRQAVQAVGPACRIRAPGLRGGSRRR